MKVKVINLSEQPSLLSQFIAEIRDVNIQNDPLRFRRNIERIGEVMAYEMSKSLHYNRTEVQTPLAMAPADQVGDSIVLGSILRAALPFHHGFLNYFDRAENAFVSAFRQLDDNNKLGIYVEYIATPNLDDKTLVLVDPMLATGGSMALSLEALLKNGTPKQIVLASIVASRQAVEYLQDEIKLDIPVSLYCAVIDPELNDDAYIVPGLGDAGDLAYGAKLRRP